MKTPTKHSSMFLFHGTSYAAIQTFFYKDFPHKKINRQRAKKKHFRPNFFKVLTQLSRASLIKNLNIFFENFGERKNWFHFEIKKRLGSDVYFPHRHMCVLCATYTDVKKVVVGDLIRKKKRLSLSSYRLSLFSWPQETSRPGHSATRFLKI
jgi:hypothetical protein